jgi:hypothetical protein
MWLCVEQDTNHCTSWTWISLSVQRWHFVGMRQMKSHCRLQEIRLATCNKVLLTQWNILECDYTVEKYTNTKQQTLLEQPAVSKHFCGWSLQKTSWHLVTIRISYFALLSFTDVSIGAGDILMKLSPFLCPSYFIIFSHLSLSVSPWSLQSFLCPHRSSFAIHLQMTNIHATVCFLSEMYIIQGLDGKIVSIQVEMLLRF